MKKQSLLLFIIFLLLLPLLSTGTSSAKAQSIYVYGDNFNVYLETNEVLSFQDSYLPYLLYLNATSGNFNATSCKVILYDNEQGSFWFTSQEACTITVTSSVSSTRLYLDNWLWGGVKSLVAGRGYYIKWFFPYAPKTSVLLIHSSLYGTSNPVAGTYDYLKGTKLSITATPINDDYSFGYWVVNGVNKTFNPLSLTLTEDTELTPVYKVENSSGVYYMLGDLFPNRLWAIKLNSSEGLTGTGFDYATVQSQVLASSKDIYSKTNSPYYVISVGQNEYAGMYNVFRQYLYFDTSALLEGVEILNASLHLKAPSYGTFDHTIHLIIQSGNPNYPQHTAFDDDYSDYNKNLYFGNFGNVSSDDWILGQYNTINIYRENANELIKTNGITKFALRTDDDINGIAPTTELDRFYYKNAMNASAYLEVWYSTNAQIIIQSNLANSPAYVDGKFAGYGNFTYGVLPNNQSTHPNYVVSFGKMQGCITPRAVSVTLGYGGIGIVTGTYRQEGTLPGFGGLDFGVIATSIFTPGILIGVISSGFFVAGRKLGHAWGAAFLGAALSLLLMGYYQAVPIYIIGIIFVLGGLSFYYLWWKRRA